MPVYVPRQACNQEPKYLDSCFRKERAGVVVVE